MMKISTQRISVFALVLSLVITVLQSTSSVSAANLSVSSVTPGGTPFISMVNLQGINASRFATATFVVKTKVGGTAVPISATYSKSYLVSRGYYTGGSTVTIPVFGLYQDKLNSVQITVKHGATSTINFTISTAAWGDSRYLNPTKLQARNSSVALGFSYFMLKNWDVEYSPTIMDVDGELRWVGNTPGYYPSQASLFHNGSIYYGSGTTLLKQEVDGTFQVLKDYWESDNVTYVGHHNYGLGKRGILLEVDRTTDIESAILEVDMSGNVLSTFDFNQIVEDAMVEGGDDPSTFVRRDADWFHSNSATYWKAQNTLVVSSRENFVIAVDYETHKIKWILGDPTKYWYSFPSLRKYALNLASGTLPPIGQHSVSITARGELMLFDNGTQSFNQIDMPGVNRSYAAPRRYQINLRTMTARMTWAYEHNQDIYSPICSSIYEDNGTYLINYASVNWGESIRLIALGKSDRVAFDYLLPGGWGNGWNAQPIHLEKLSFLR